MSFDEIAELLKIRDSERKEKWEQLRIQCYYSMVAFHGNKEYKNPQGLFPLPWEKKKVKEVKKLSKEELAEKTKKAQQWLETNKYR